MPRALPTDEAFRVAHYLARATPRGECLCIGTGRHYPSWHKLGRKTERLSLLICRAVHGQRPSGRAVVMHSCDNKACINPDHLSWGTQAENLADALRKGRRTVPPLPNQRELVRRGKHKWAKLKPEDVTAIRERLAAGERQASIAADFGITFQQVSKIKLGQRWGWQNDRASA